MAKKRRRKKKKGLWNLIKKHKAASAVIALFLVCIIVVAGVIGTIAWNLYHDSIGIVDPDDVDPTADKVQIAREDPKDDDVINVLLVGSDSRDPNAEMGRSDTMILVSYNKAENKGINETRSKKRERGKKVKKNNTSKLVMFVLNNHGQLNKIILQSC